MDCRECTENLTAYLDGELSSADSAQIHSHLEICFSCAAELRDLQEAADLVQSHTGDLEVNPESWNAIYDRIQTVRPASPFGFLVPKWSRVLATAAIMTVIAFGYLWYQHDQKRSLDDYIAQYMKSRETGLRAQTMNSFIPNPFSEARPASDTNPFQLEDR